MMKTNVKLFPKILLIVSLVSQLNAWYPDYSVLATEFPVRNDFLRPLQLHSTAMLGMGEYFQFLYSNQPDFRFIDPTYPLRGKKHILYADLGAETIWRDGMGRVSTVYPMMDAISSSSVSDYSFWSPYREFSHEQIPEPALRLFYLRQIGGDASALTMGASYSISYDETQFYQPYSFDYFRSYDAMGASVENADAYDDYRLRESGEDESISTEHQLNLMLSKQLSTKLAVGARLGMVKSSVDGNYHDYNYYDQSDWNDIYENLWDNDLKRLQSTDMTDFNLGIAYTTSANDRFAVNGGLINGSLDRSFNQLDTSRYLSVTLNPDGNAATSDSNIYRSSSYSLHDKEWAYDGSGYYVRFLAELPKSESLTLRYGGLVEWRSADLTESEIMRSRSNYYNQYYASYDNLWRRYESRSSAELDRSGSGTLQSSFYQLSGGADWQLQPGIRFYGGLYFDHYDRSQDANEPFIGDKYAYNSTDGYSYDYDEYEVTQHDNKTFIWNQHEWRTVLAVPMGIEYELAPALGVQLGLTKVFERVMIEESYDVLYDEYHLVELRDGITTRDETDADYVDGYEYPVMREFDNRFDFNAGLNIRSGDNLRVTVVLSNGFQENYSLKIGGSISW